MISVVILTFNEERNIERCLKSVRWSDDVLVVDSFSTDNTVAIAQQLGARVIQRKFDNFAAQRNFALDHGELKHQWVLHLDADEEVTSELAEELGAVTSNPACDAYRVAAKLIWQGRWLRHAGLFPWYQVRFGRKDALRFYQAGHGQREVVAPERIGTLRAGLPHYPFSKGLHDWIEKHNRYSSAEAKRNVAGGSKSSLTFDRRLLTNQDVRRRTLKSIFARLPFRPTLRFTYMAVVRRGLLDGMPGLTYCRLLTWYERMIVLKEREERTPGTAAPSRETSVGETAAHSRATQPGRSVAGKAALSVLIPVKNEAANLRACMESVQFADEIVVVDSGSTDGTREIASERGASIVDFEWNGAFPRKKNWALENVPWRHEWVLIIDADERITPALEQQIQDAIKRSDVDGFYLNRRYWFLDGWINHSARFPNWNLRLFRHRHGRYERFDIVSPSESGDNEVHEHVLLKGRAEYLSEPMEHYAFPDLATFIEKHNRYSTWEAQVAQQMTQGGGGKLQASLFGSPMERRRSLKRASALMPFRPTLRFIYHYVIGQGFRDGYRGFVLSRLMAWYEWLITLKLRELRRESARR